MEDNKADWHKHITKRIAVIVLCLVGFRMKHLYKLYIYMFCNCTTLKRTNILYCILFKFGVTYIVYL